MMCYRDMTFCHGDGCALFDECPRALTQEVKDAAKARGLLVARFTEPKAMACYTYPDKATDKAPE